MISEELIYDHDDIDAEIEVVTTKVTNTIEANKSLLDIITKMTYGETASVSLPITTAQQPPIKSPSRTSKVSSKYKGAQPSKDATTMQASEEPNTKKAKTDQTSESC